MNSTSIEMSYSPLKVICEYQTLLQSSNENWTASRVWPLMCVVSLTTHLMLTGHCRRMTFSNLSNLYPKLNFCVHILGLSIPSRIGHQRNLSKAIATGVSGQTRRHISAIFAVTYGNHCITLVGRA